MNKIAKTIWVVTLLGMALSACAAPFAPRLVRGSGDVIVEERRVSGFDEILISGAGRVIVTQGTEESLSIETDDNLMEYIETRVRDRRLEIGFQEGTMLSPGGGSRVLEPTDGIIFRISVIDLNSIMISGAAKVELEKLKTDQIEVVLSGAGEIRIPDLDANRLEVLVSGAGDVELAGYAGSQNVRLSGLGRYRAFALRSQEAGVTISGAGGAEMWVTDLLDVTISGAGDVSYYGEPQVNPEISGVGRIQGLGDK